MRTKETIRKKKLCARCNRRGSVSCIYCNFNTSFREYVIQLVREELREKIRDEPIVDEYNRMTKYLLDKYGERRL